MTFLISLTMVVFNLMIQPSLFAGEAAPLKIMNGIQMTDYKNFEKKWKLVTVRFRKDTEEMRFTYANTLAYKTLSQGLIEYPDGAVFAKISYKTQEDESFPSSAVPSGARRFQFMIRNKKKYPETNGWNYALFNDRGFLFPEDVKTQTMACAACHNAVPERGYVFSKIMNPLSLNPQTTSRLTFSSQKKEDLPKRISDLLPKEVSSVRVLEGEIAKSIFQGTLEEIRPALSKEAARTNIPAVLFNKESSRFSLVIPENNGVPCGDALKPGRYMKSLFTTLNNFGDGSEKILHFCYTP